MQIATVQSQMFSVVELYLSLSVLPQITWCLKGVRRQIYFNRLFRVLLELFVTLMEIDVYSLLVVLLNRNPAGCYRSTCDCGTKSTFSRKGRRWQTYLSWKNTLFATFTTWECSVNEESKCTLRLWVFHSPVQGISRSAKPQYWISQGFFYLSLIEVHPQLVPYCLQTLVKHPHLPWQKGESVEYYPH